MSPPMITKNRAANVLTEWKKLLPQGFLLEIAAVDNVRLKEAMSVEAEEAIRYEMFMKSLSAIPDTRKLSKIAGFPADSALLLEVCTVLTDGKVALPTIYTPRLREACTKEEKTRKVNILWDQLFKDTTEDIDPSDPLPMMKGFSGAVAAPRKIKPMRVNSSEDELEESPEQTSSQVQTETPRAEHPWASMKGLVMAMADHAMKKQQHSDQTPPPESVILLEENEGDLSPIESSVEPDHRISEGEESSETRKAPDAEGAEDEEDSDDGFWGRAAQRKLTKKINNKNVGTSSSFKNYPIKESIKEKKTKRQLSNMDSFHQTRAIIDKIELASESTLANQTERPSNKAKGSREAPIAGYEIKEAELLWLDKSKKERTPEEDKQIQKWIRDKLTHATKVPPGLQLKSLIREIPENMNAGQYALTRSTLEYSLTILHLREKERSEEGISADEEEMLSEACQCVGLQIGLSSMTAVAGQIIDYCWDVKTDMEARSKVPQLTFTQSAENVAKATAAHTATMKNLQRSLESAAANKSQMPFEELVKNTEHSSANTKHSIPSIISENRQSSAPSSIQSSRVEKKNQLKVAPTKKSQVPITKKADKNEDFATAVARRYKKGK